MTGGGAEVAAVGAATGTGVSATVFTAAAAAAPAAGGKVEEDDTEMKPSFPALSGAAAGGGRIEYRSVRVPPHRYTPLREDWDAVVKYLVEHMKLQIRMNTKLRTVQLKTTEETPAGYVQKAEDFLRAYMLGFALQDAVALLRLDDLFVDSFEVNDVKMLKGDHLSRAIGRIAGQGGKTKYAIENATRTRIVVADSKIHILGAYANIQVAKDTICSLILGTPPGKVYNQMRHVASRLQQRM